jgi:hypothetical protein
MPFAFDPQTLALVSGAGGIACSVLWGLFRGRTTMLVVQLIGTLMFVAHWHFQGSPTATLLTVMSAVQMAAAIPLGTRPGFRYVYLATLPVIAVLLALTWNGWPSVFASLGTAVLSIGRYQTDTLRFRVLMGAAVPLWFVHNLMMMSVPALASDFLGTAVNGYMIHRMLVEERRARRERELGVPGLVSAHQGG